MKNAVYEQIQARKVKARLRMLQHAQHTIHTLSLSRLAVTCALHHRLARFSAGFVPKLFPTFSQGCT
jgi:hypothetical protein